MGGKDSTAAQASGIAEVLRRPNTVDFETLANLVSGWQDQAQQQRAAAELLQPTPSVAPPSAAAPNAELQQPTTNVAPPSAAASNAELQQPTSSVAPLSTGAPAAARESADDPVPSPNAVPQSGTPAPSEISVNPVPGPTRNDDDHDEEMAAAIAAKDERFFLKLSTHYLFSGTMSLCVYAYLSRRPQGGRSNDCA